MELKIINKKDEPLLSRIRVESDLVFEKTTPSAQDVKSKLASVLGKDEKLIVIKGIYTRFGLKNAKNVSYVYENVDLLKRIETKNKKKTKKKEGKPEKTDETPQEAKKEAKKDEKPKETKSEPKQEEKPKEQKQ